MPRQRKGTESDYRRDRAHRERERAREGRLFTITHTERDLEALKAALENPSVADERSAVLYYKFDRLLKGG